MISEPQQSEDTLNDATNIENKEIAVGKFTVYYKNYGTFNVIVLVV